MTCKICGVTITGLPHDFFEGVAPQSVSKGQPWRPARTWTYVAALYHFAAPIGTTPNSIVNFCGATHATEYRRAYG